MESTKNRPHQSLSLEKKLEILKELDRSSLTKTEVAKKFNIPKSTLSRILKNKNTIEGAVKNGTFTSKRMRMTPYEELGKVVFVWFKRARSSNFPISGPILEQKAREIALQMGVENFALSNGWLSCFKKSHGLVFKAISGESAAVNRDICTDWQQGRLQEILDNYEPRDVFNVDEMGLFYKVLPSKTLAFKGEACSGGKHSRDRITVLISACVRSRPAHEPLEQLGEGQEAHWEVVERILFLYAKLNPGLGYVQGMNEIIGPIYYTLVSDPNPEWRKYAEADCFFCFTSLMSEIRDFFIKTLDESSSGIGAMMERLMQLLRRRDDRLYGHLKQLQVEPQYYSFRWIMLLLSQDFPLPDVLRIWDSLFADPQRFTFLIYLCYAMLSKLRDKLMMGDFPSNIKLLQNFPDMDVSELISQALSAQQEDLMLSFS
ncbi:TBC1 domain family member 13 [Rhipicephalus sanguineus]|uniref:TBC1 domain family member 13 n=1 Tax=Rhipicephalus sanguineus TaxID=34632 RepID=UPI0020C31EE1|nr:TBC1 domain family member 13 [Rhipicephalus sanguineus]